MFCILPTKNAITDPLTSYKSLVFVISPFNSLRGLLSAVVIMEAAAECKLPLQPAAAAADPCSCWLPPPVPRKKPITILTRLGVLLAGVTSARAGEVLYDTLVFDPRRRGEVWRFVSYMLLHAGAAHAALNLGIQLLLAVPLEREQGRRRTALLYIGGGLAGSLSTSVLEPDLFLVGASGGVYALLTAQLANIVLNFPGLRYRLHRAVVVCVLSLADILFSLYHHFFLGNRCPRVGWAAHTGGAVAGLLLGLLMFRAPSPEAFSLQPRLLPTPAPLQLAGHKPRRQAVLTAIRCSAAALLAGALAAAIALNSIRPSGAS
ncbi:hypothetical protein B566_EDAN012012 [Ephemera danica]|nr:hypothetical protein B566_EDAN012012 [Ephemera danica]